jgi:hypothetical protein
MSTPIWLQRGLLILAGLVFGLLIGSQWQTRTVTLPGWGDVVTSALGIGAMGVTIGVLAATVGRSFWQVFWSRSTVSSLTLPSNILGGVSFAVLTAMVSIIDSALRAGLVSLEHAALGLSLAMLTFLSGVLALASIQRGESVELETHWGGLGGVLGGWRVSPLAILILFVLIFASGSIVVLRPQSGPVQAAPSASGTVAATPARAPTAAAGRKP